MMILQFRGVSDTTIHIVAATQIRWDGANALSEVRFLCSDSRAFKVYETSFMSLDLTVTWLILH